MGYGQSVEEAREHNRLERRFWSWSDDDYVLVEVSAFAADGHAPKDGYWWVPQLGFSGGEGHHLFPTKFQAAMAAERKINKQIKRLEMLRGNIDAA
jgi:hypothetical protein